LKSDAEEAERTLKAGEVVKIQLGAQIDGFCSIVCDTIIIPSDSNKDGELPGRQADLLLAAYWCNELLLRMMIPPGTLATGTDEEKAKAQTQKPYTQNKMNELLTKVCKSYEVNLVENDTCWMFDRNEIESKKKLIFAPGEGVRGEGLPELGEAWGVEIGVSLGTGKVKNFSDRTTLHRRTETTYGLKRPSSRATLSEIVKKFGTFPFSLRQLEDERAGKVGIVECVRGGVIRSYEVIGDKDNEPVARLFTTVGTFYPCYAVHRTKLTTIAAITKNGLTKFGAPKAPNLESFKTDKKITDEEILKILESPLAKASGSKTKNKKKKKKPAAKAANEEEGDESDEE